MCYRITKSRILTFKIDILKIEVKIDSEMVKKYLKVLLRDI